MRRIHLVTVATVVGIVAAAALLHASQKSASPGTLTAADRLEILELYTRYSQMFDLPEGSAEGWASTFTDNGVFLTMTGHKALAEFWTKNHAEPNRPQRRHFTTLPLLTPTAEGATGTCYLMMVNASQTPPAMLSAGVYDDTLVKTAQGWRFQKRSMRPASAQPPETHP